MGTVKFSEVPIGQVAAFILSFYFQKKIFWTIILSKLLIRFNHAIENLWKRKGIPNHGRPRPSSRGWNEEEYDNNEENIFFEDELESFG